LDCSPACGFSRRKETVEKGCSCVHVEKHFFCHWSPVSPKLPTCWRSRWKRVCTWPLNKHLYSCRTGETALEISVSTRVIFGVRATTWSLQIPDLLLLLLKRLSNPLGAAKEPSNTHLDAVLFAVTRPRHLHRHAGCAVRRKAADDAVVRLHGRGAVVCAAERPNPAAL
jgi:hypothetical protein